MKYLALIYGEEGAGRTLAGGTGARDGRVHGALEGGRAVGGNELDSVATATTVRVRDDETLVTDGPFAELKEVLGGYYLFECESIDEACAWAAKIPAARHGAIEVRPVYVDEEGERR